MDIPEGGPAQAHGGSRVGKAAVHKHDVRAVHRHIRSGADGHARIRPGQGGSVVDAVADHQHPAFLLQGADNPLLAVGQHPGGHVVHAGQAGHGPCGALVVPGEQDGFQPQAAEALNGPGGILPDHVRHGDDAQQPPVLREEEGRFSLPCQGFRPGAVRGDAQGAEPGPAAAGEGFPAGFAGEAVAGEGGEAFQVPGGDALGLRGPDHGPGQGMLAAVLQGAGGGEQLLPGNPGGGKQVRYGGLAPGYGAGFVQRRDLRPSGGFQGFPGFEENAVFRAHAAAGHDGHGGGQPQGAGAGNHQHGDAPGQGEGQGFTGDEPAGGNDQGNQDHRGNEDAGHPVRDAGDGGLGGRGVGNHADNLGKGGVFPHPGGPAGQEAGAVEGGGGNRVPLRLVHGDAFPGEGGLIHGAGALRHHAVHGNALPGTHHEQVPGNHFLHRHGNLLPLPQEGGGLRGDAHQALQGVGGMALGDGFQHFPHGDQGRDHGGGLKIQLAVVQVHEVRVRAAPGDDAAHAVEHGGAPEEGHGGAQGHQGVHVGGAVPQGGKTGGEEFSVDDHDAQGEQQLGQGQGQMVPPEESGQRRPQHVGPHGQVHEHQQEPQGEDQPALQLRGFGILQQVFPG